MNAYDLDRKDEMLSVELTPAEFEALALRNGWDARNVRMYLDLTGVPGWSPTLPRPSVRMGRLQITLVGE